MAQINTPSRGFKRLQTPTESTASPSPMPQIDDDSDEWEYEYSTTETETYYVTLDLTIPNLSNDKSANRTQGKPKGRLRSRWTNPGLGRNRQKYLKAATYGAFADDNEDGERDSPDPDMEPEDDEEDDDDEAVEANEIHHSSADEADAAEAAEISILDLHSDNPLMSYNGSMYSCQWATNVGTELLFMAHDRDSTLPVLRKLAGGVDLLAASSARLISNPVELEPRKRKRSPDRAYERGSRLRAKDRLLPVGNGANDRRKDQATFLENLMNVKDARGEEDQVSVMVEKRLSNRKWKDRNKVAREAERRGLMKICNNRQKRHGPDAVAAAQQRIREMDEEDIKTANLVFNHPKRKLAYKNAPGRKAKGVVGADAALAAKNDRGPSQPRSEEQDEEDIYSNGEDFATPEMGLDPIEEGDEEEEFYSAEEDTQNRVEDAPGEYDDDEVPGDYDEDTQM